MMAAIGMLFEIISDNIDIEIHERLENFSDFRRFGYRIAINTF